MRWEGGCYFRGVLFGGVWLSESTRWNMPRGAPRRMVEADILGHPLALSRSHEGEVLQSAFKAGSDECPGDQRR
jgi:hypothetical protein